MSEESDKEQEDRLKETAFSIVKEITDNTDTKGEALYILEIVKMGFIMPDTDSITQNDVEESLRYIG